MPLFHSGGGGSNPTSALQLIIRETSIERARQLNALWHSLLPELDPETIKMAARRVCYRAEFDDRAYAVAIWSSPIAANRMLDGERKLELRRFAIAPDAPPNTASRLLSVMRRLVAKRWPDLVQLVSYQAIEHHSGTIYRAAGWHQEHHRTLEPTLDNGRIVKTKPWHQSKIIPQTTSPKIRWIYNLVATTPILEHKTKMVKVLVSPSEDKMLRRAAKHANMRLATWMREQLLRAAAAEDQA